MNKKGTTTIEAAVVFPLVLLAIFGIIYIYIYFFQGVSGQSNSHIVLRQRAGEKSKTVEYLINTTGRFPIQQDRNRTYYHDVLVFQKKGILMKQQKNFYGSYYIVKGKEVVQYADLIDAATRKGVQD